jgi:hypothetical protein
MKWGLLTTSGIEPITESVLLAIIRNTGSLYKGRYLAQVNQCIKVCPSLEGAIDFVQGNLKSNIQGHVWESVIKVPGAMILSLVESLQLPKPEFETMLDLIDLLEGWSEQLHIEKATKDPREALAFQRLAVDLMRQWSKELDGVSLEYAEKYTKFLEGEDWATKTDEEIQDDFAKVSSWIPLTVIKATPTIITQGMQQSFKIALQMREGLIDIDGLKLDYNFDLKDTKAINNLSKMGYKQMPWSYANMGQSVTASMQRQLQQGLTEGLNYKVVVNDIVKALPQKITNKEKHFLNVTAQNVLARSRSQSQLLTYRNAEITYIKAHSVLDQRTTPFCRWIHGQVLEVNNMADYYQNAIDTDADPRQAFPWVKEKTNKDTGIQTFSFQDPSGKNRVFASGVEGAVKFEKGYNMNKIQGYGIFPPYHALCRTTTYFDDEA